MVGQGFADRTSSEPTVCSGREAGIDEVKAWAEFSELVHKIVTLHRGEWRVEQIHQPGHTSTPTDRVPVALSVALLVGSTVGGGLFLLQLVLPACVLWRRMHIRVQYLQLLHPESALPTCTTRVFQAGQSSCHISLKDVRFVVPPQFNSSLGGGTGGAGGGREQRSFGKVQTLQVLHH
ncbi:hypothetical protein GN956_G23001 [Arapaima gigas]